MITKTMQKLIIAVLAIAVACCVNAATLLDCAGSGSYLLLGTPDALQLADSTPFTLEGWLRLRSLKASDIFYSKATARTASSYTFMFGCRDNGRVGAYSGVASWKYATPSVYLDTDRWYHLAYSYDGTNLAFFVDGKSYGSSPFSYKNTASHTTKIGGHIPAADFDGHTSDIRFWDHARSATEIAATMHHRLQIHEPGLLAHWPLDDGSGPEARDQSLFGSHGTLMDSAAWSEIAPPPTVAASDTLYIVGNNGFYGEVTPPYGSHDGLTQYETISCSAPTGYQYHPRDNRYRALCSGYSIITNREAPPLLSGNTTSFAYLHDSSNPLSLLLWHWDVEYKINVEDAANGGVDTSESWYSAGSPVTITALPAANYHFTHWSGAVPLGQERSVTLSFNADQPRTITPHFSEVYYVKTDGSDVADGRSWETAKATIQAAVDLAQDGNLVLVAEGVYDSGGKPAPRLELTNRVCVTKPITLRSVGGVPELTVIAGAADPLTGAHGTNAIRCLYLGEGASISGFTLTGGHTATNRKEQAESCGGGALLMPGSYLDNCLVVTNRASFNGGGIFCNGGGLVTGTRVIENISSRAGGGIYCDKFGTISNCTVRSNNALGDGLGPNETVAGGGIFCNGYNSYVYGMEIIDSVIADNIGRGTGGGIRTDFGPTTIKSCTITNNETYGPGAGIYAWGRGLIYNSLIADNTSSYNNMGGGGAYLHAGSRIEHSVIRNNYNPYSGGGLYLRGTSHADNCLIIGNRVKNNLGGGVRFSENTSTLKNCTITDNSCDNPESGGGVSFGGTSSTMQSCVVWGNSDDNIHYTGAPTVSYSCSWPLWQGEGEANIDTSPRFANPAKGNYHLGSGSACIDNGLIEEWMATGVDLDGQRRIRGDNVDIGCYEYHPQQTLLLVR